MKGQKLLSLSGAALMALTLIGATSCGGSGKKETSQTNLSVDYVPEAAFDKTKNVEINFYHTMGKNLQEVFDLYLEDFYALYPNIKVNPLSVGGYDDVRDQMTTELAANKKDGADLAYCYPDHVAAYNQAKSVISLEGLMNDSTYGFGFTDNEINDFVDAYYEEGRCFGDGKMYSLPLSKSSEVLYYNMTKFAELGLDVPTHWFSTGDNDKLSMEYVCKVIKEANPSCTPLGYDSAANWFITMCEQTGTAYTSATGKHFLFNNEDAKSFVRKFVDWRNKGYITTKVLYGSYTSSAFASQELYMCIGSTAGAGYQAPTPENGVYPFETGIAEIPQANSEKKAVIQQGPSVCIFNKADRAKVQASWLLLKYLTTSVDFQAQFSLVSGYTPVIKSVETNTVYKDKLSKANTTNNLQGAAIKQSLAQKASYFVSPAFPGSSVARNEVENLLNGCLEGKDINTCFADAISKCEASVK